MISVNLDKAKAIAHEKRRLRREHLFAPHDSVIAKQIPGNDMSSAENARAAIRAADASYQSQIDQAINTEQIKGVLVAYGAI